MYHEFRSDNKRSGWVYTYKGVELLALAESRLRFYAAAEHEARETVSRLMLDKSVAASDKRIGDARSEVETNGSIHEQCLVWVHEFARTPDREFILSLGDVVFFGLVQAGEPPARRMHDDDRNDYDP